MKTEKEYVKEYLDSLNIVNDLNDWSKYMTVHRNESLFKEIIRFVLADVASLKLKDMIGDTKVVVLGGGRDIGKSVLAKIIELENIPAPNPDKMFIDDMKGQESKMFTPSIIDVPPGYPNEKLILAKKNKVQPMTNRFPSRYVTKNKRRRRK